MQNVQHVFLVLLLTLGAASGCLWLSEASTRVAQAQRHLASVRPKVEKLLAEYDRALQARLEECEAREPLTPDQRAECLGDYHPESALSVNIRRLRQVYDQSADDLQSLQLLLEVLESMTAPADTPKEGNAAHDSQFFSLIGENKNKITPATETEIGRGMVYTDDAACEPL